MHNLILALLVHYTKLTAEEAEKIADQFGKSIIPHDYQGAEVLVNKILADIKELDS